MAAERDSIRDMGLFKDCKTCEIDSKKSFFEGVDQKKLEDSYIEMQRTAKKRAKFRCTKK